MRGLDPRIHPQAASAADGSPAGNSDVSEFPVQEAKSETSDFASPAMTGEVRSPTFCAPPVLGPAAPGGHDGRPAREPSLTPPSPAGHLARLTDTADRLPLVRTPPHRPRQPAAAPSRRPCRGRQFRRRASRPQAVFRQAAEPAARGRPPGDRAHLRAASAHLLSARKAAVPADRPRREGPPARPRRRRRHGGR